MKFVTSEGYDVIKMYNDIRQKLTSEEFEKEALDASKGVYTASVRFRRQLRAIKKMIDELIRVSRGHTHVVTKLRKKKRDPNKPRSTFTNTYKKETT